MNSVVITGVSTGIGLAIAQAAVEAGWRVFGSVRNDADAERLRALMPEHFEPLVFDVTDREAIDRAAARVAEALGNARLDGLVNNAGIAVPGPLLHLPADELRRQMEVNVIGVLQVTQAFAGLLGADAHRQGKPGKIVMISSISGRNTSPFVGAYAASKHALEGLSGSLRRELMLYGIDVVVIGPGAVKTPIWNKATLDAYSGTPYRQQLKLALQFMLDVAAKGLEPRRCADLVMKILRSPRPKTRYVIAPNPLRDWWLPRLLPERFVDWVIAKKLKLEPPKQSR